VAGCGRCCWLTVWTALFGRRRRPWVWGDGERPCPFSGRWRWGCSAVWLGGGRRWWRPKEEEDAPEGKPSVLAGGFLSVCEMRGSGTMKRRCGLLLLM
jgi:hypothetical protein